ncbi:flagellar hook-length control protein FliK [Poseidonibacter antarcticus]|uniref:flagellar hook-length control protein FliK n=1 Tax=Poseidonibacter antarcticus TaxID=2478538 RepID=UPI000EF47BC6|nr:flagellar hook-length control protein FliK [Poseidonibacter antarcticus]
MLVSNNSLLNILLPNDNKALKDVLKQADSSTLEQMVKNKSISVNDILKNLFDDVKTRNKSNSTIENILKNSPIFKNLGSFSSSLSSMIKNIDEDSNLQKFKPLLENFSKNIQNLDANSLKEQLSKSGVFLESKIAQSNNQNSNLNTNLQKVLAQIQDLVKDINTPQAKQINELIQKVLQSSDSIQQTINLKNLSTSLQNLNNSLSTTQTTNLLTLKNQLNSIINDGNLVESKIENNSNNTNTNLKDQINTQIKDLLNQIKNELSQNPSLQNKNILNVIETLLKTNDLFTHDTKSMDVKSSSLNNFSNLSTFTNNLSTNLNSLVLALKDTISNLEPKQNNVDLQNNILKNIDKLENIIKEAVLNPSSLKNEPLSISNDIKSILLQMQDEISSKIDPKSQEILKQVDKLLTQIEYHQLTSFTSNSNYVYLPFFWDMLEDGSINMKKSEDEKFYCQINLTLKDFGKVDLMMSMYDSNKIDLTIYAQREHFKIAVRDNLQNLKKALNDIDLIPVNIKLLDLKEDKEKTDIDKKTDAFVNPYSDQITTNIDIRA